MSKMTESELKAILAAEIADSIGHIGGELSEQRRKALDYYLGQPFGNEIEGRSKVVSTDVADVIEWILPSLLRIFTAGDDVVRYEPTGPEDEEVARQATEYANWIFNRDNSGFIILYCMMKDALLQKNGIGKVWWEETEEERREVYRQKTPEEMQMLLADPDVELLELREYQAERIGIDATGAVVALPVSYHDVTVKRRSRNGRVRVVPVPPEEFLISRRARGIEEAAFVGHRVRRTVSELLALGYDRKIVEALPDAVEDEPSGEERARFDFDDTGNPGGSLGLNRAMREVWITECYIRADWDGDGIAERRKITVGGSGEEILDNEPWDGPLPFISLTPIIMPHRFFGLSVADLVMDLQLIKSTILRQILDNLYLSNNGRHVISDQVNLDDMLTVRPGGIVRLKSGAMPSQGHVLPLDTPLVAAQAFPMLEYLDGVREGRTGVTRYNQGFYVLSGAQQLRGIGQNKVDRFFWNDVNQSHLHRISSAVDPVNKLYVVSYPSQTSVNGTADKLLIYSWQTDRWSRAEQPLALLHQGASQASYTLEGLDSISTNLDALPFSLDSRAWTGAGRLLLGGFSTANRAGFFSGQPMAAVVDTGESQLLEGSRTLVRGVRPLADGGMPSVALGYRNRLTDAVQWGPDVAQNDRGACPQRASARYFRARLKIPAGQSWTHLQGIDEIDAAPAGRQ